MDVINLCFSHFNGKYSRVARRNFSTNSNWMSKGHEWAERYADRHVLPTLLYIYIYIHIDECGFFVFAHNSKPFYVFFWQSTFCRVVVTKFRIYAQMLILHAHAGKPIREEWEANKKEQHLPFAFQNHIRIKAFGRSAASLCLRSILCWKNNSIFEMSAVGAKHSMLVFHFFFFVTSIFLFRLSNSQ